MPELKIIAHIRTDFDTKFGIPRQSGLVKGLKGEIVFEPEFRNIEAFRGLEGYSHIWLLWDFSLAHREDDGWSPTVRPPRLGGNRRMGVWATRSPFRPNNIGLSSVRLLDIQLHTPQGPKLIVEGADLMDGTPIYDIKPYLPFTDSHPDATGGFAEEQFRTFTPMSVIVPDSMRSTFSDEQIDTIKELLAADPRPHYHNEEERIYTMSYADKEIRFRVTNNIIIIMR